LFSRSVRDNALGSIIGGIVLAILAAAAGKVTGWLPQLWDAGRSSMRWLWSLLTSQISLTLWGWVWSVVWLLLALALRAFWRRSRRESTGREAAVNGWPQLGDLESTIIRLLAEMDGQAVFLTDLSTRLQTSQLRISKALENLEAIGFIAPEHNVLYGTKAGLTRRGRDYVLEQGFGR
jgi:hypothetical protein